MPRAARGRTLGASTSTSRHISICPLTATESYRDSNFLRFNKGQPAVPSKLARNVSQVSSGRGGFPAPSVEGCAC